MFKEEPKFQNRYSIRSARLPGYDYSTTGLYAVTICVKDRKCWFGKVVQGVIELSEIGKIVEEELLKTMERRPNVVIDPWVVMPNHVHLVVGIDNQTVETPRWGVSGSNMSDMPGCKGTMRQTPYQGVSTDTRAKVWQPNCLGSIINQIKSSCTKRIWHAGYRSFFWQSRFYDQIMWNDQALKKMTDYINTNPERWDEDEYYVV